MQVSHLLLLLCVLILGVQGNNEKIIFASDTTDCLSAADLQPFKLGQPLNHPYTALRSSLISSSAFLYPLHNLAPGSNYEVRIAYPATVPTDFELSLICQQVGTGLWGVLIQGTYAGVSQLEGADKIPVPADIVLEELALGVVYHGIYKVILSIIGALFVGNFIIIPRIRAFLLQPSKQD